MLLILFINCGNRQCETSLSC